MITNMYVIFDAKAKFYNKPFCMLNDSVAIRAAKDLVRDPKTECSKNPADFTLFRIGKYQDETATIQNSDIHHVVCRFHELQKYQETVLQEAPGETKSITG